MNIIFRAVIRGILFPLVKEDERAISAQSLLVRWTRCNQAHPKISTNPLARSYGSPVKKKKHELWDKILFQKNPNLLTLGCWLRSAQVMAVRARLAITRRGGSLMIGGGFQRGGSSHSKFTKSPRQAPH